MRWGILVALAITSPAVASPFRDDPLGALIFDEVAAAMNLSSAGKPYFASISVRDLRRVRVVADFGALVSSDSSPQRLADIDVRLGDHAFDSGNVTNPNRDGLLFRDRVPASLGPAFDLEADRRNLRTGVLRQYERSRQSLELKKQIASQTSAPAFSNETPRSIVDARVPRAFDQARLEQLAKKLSGVLRSNRDMLIGHVEITATSGRELFASSEGTASMQPVSVIEIEVSCAVRGDEGLRIDDGLAIHASTIDELPTEAELVRRVEQLAREMSAIRTARIDRTYAGPVVFDGVAAGQVLRALIMDDLIGTPASIATTLRRVKRAPRETRWGDSVGKPVFPPGTTIVDDPTLSKFGTARLFGGYAFDAQGVPAQPSRLVDNGVVKQFVMSRTPRAGFGLSNGHGTWGSDRAGIANVVVTGNAGVEIWRRARELAAARGLDYVLVVERLSHDDLDAFRMSLARRFPAPAAAKRVYADGRVGWVRVEDLVPTLDELVAVGSKPTAYSWSEYAHRPITIAAAPLLFKLVRVVQPRWPERPEVQRIPRPKLP